MDVFCGATVAIYAQLSPLWRTLNTTSLLTTGPRTLQLSIAYPVSMVKPLRLHAEDFAISLRGEGRCGLVARLGHTYTFIFTRHADSAS